MATRTRKGFIRTVMKRRGPYYSGHIGVGGRIYVRCSYDRAEVEAWLADRLAENPTYEVGTNRRGGSRETAPAAPADEWNIARKHVAGERPVPRVNPFAGSGPAASETPSLWMVVAETNPLTAMYHLRLKADWPRPRKVLCHDVVSEAPVSWVADDNGGEGYGSREEARIASLAAEHDPSVMLTVRPLSRRWRDIGFNDCATH